MLICAVADAPDPPPPEKLTEGAVVYPDPGLVTVIDTTFPPETVAIAVALPPTITLGALVYPLPPPATPFPLFTVILVTPDVVVLALAFAGSCP